MSRPIYSRVPLELALVLALLVLLVWLGVELAVSEIDPLRQLALVGAIVCDAVVIYGLARLRRWALWSAAIAFAVAAALLLLRAITDDFDPRLIVVWVASIAVAWYLLAPSTRRMSALGLKLRWDLSALVPLALFAYLPSFLVVFVGTNVGGPEWLTGVLALAAVTPHFWLSAHTQAKISAPLVRRPEDLVDDRQHQRFKDAVDALRAGQLEHVETLAQELGDIRTARILLGRVAIMRARQTGGLARIVFDTTVGKEQDEQLAAEIRSANVTALVTRRVQLLDDLLADATSRRPAFADQFKPWVETLLDVQLRMNEVVCFHEQWQSERPTCSGDYAIDWLTRRLWSRSFSEAAETAARRGRNTKLAAAIQQSAACCRALRVYSDWRSAETHSRWRRLLAHTPDLCLVPSASESLDLLSVEGPFANEHGVPALAERLRVGLLRLLEAEELRVEPAGEIGATMFLALLTGYAPQRRRLNWLRRESFERWWQRRRTAHISFASQMALGLDAFVGERWDEAAEAFQAASEHQPDRRSAAYNRIVALVRADRAGDGEQAAAKLLVGAQDDVNARVYLADCQRAQGRLDDAIGNYRRAAEVAGLGTKLALRLGYTLAEADATEEAHRMFVAAVGRNAEPSRMDEMARLLGERGYLELAQRQRALAQFKRIGEVEEFDDLDDTPPSEQSTWIH